MSEENHHHHHHKEETNPSDQAVQYSESTYASGGTYNTDDGLIGGYAQSTTYGEDGNYGYAKTTQVVAPEVDYRKEKKEVEHKEHLGELGAGVAGVFAVHEKHEVEKDPEHAHMHKLEERIAEAAIAGEGGYVLHEHHEKKELKKEEKEVEHGKKHHHLF